MAMQQSAFSTQKDVFAEVIHHISNPDNVWKPDTYLNQRRSGHAFGEYETSFTVKYVLGAAFLHGYIGNLHFRLFYQRNGLFQLAISDTAVPLTDDVKNDFSCHPDNPEDLLQWLSECNMG